MTSFDAFRYDGKRVLVVGGATGMGAATAALALDAGAEVIVMDFAAIDNVDVTPIHVNLADAGSIDGAVDACGGPIDALFACAGVADGTPDIERINFLGHRHLIERALDAEMLPRGSAIGFISSAAGLGWERSHSRLSELFDTPDMDAGTAWFAENRWADYFHTKQAVCAWVAGQAYRFLQHGVRINATCPGPTDTPLAQANADLWLELGSDYREVLGMPTATALEQAYPLLFLCSDAARGIAGVTLVTDAGYLSAGMTHAFPSATGMAEGLYGRKVR